MSQDKPREFLLKAKVIDGLYCPQECVFRDHVVIRVIEKSAYDALEEKLRVAVKLIEDEVDCEYNGTYRLGNQNLQNFPAHDKENCRKCQTLTKIKGGNE